MKQNKTIRKILSTPLLTPLVENRPFRITSASVAGTHLGLVVLGLPSWQCPIRYGLGVPVLGVDYQEQFERARH